ncbi:uncharacterized protein LOC102701620 [Oryza brachyantha]|uniref:uncharacterized protein LOC102701620 n=1 Tax=Oryza brachyantha TaxID=4533 RepID=UPI001ADA8366|nr:uncharacterized protein LOC102701620 [Oryza brachyantha]
MTKLPVDLRQRLTLEDYILFFTTRSGHGINMDHLNQIIFMHGFVKLHRHNKPVIVDALNKLDLMRPRRSTVGINAAAPPPGASKPSDALLSTEEARADMEDLGWRECPVGSLLSVRAGESRPSATHVPIAAIRPGSAAVECISPPGILSASSLASPIPAAAKRKRCRRSQGKAAMMGKKRRVVQLLTLPSVEDMAATA